ncbi:hypothetical protein HELRODRAFT_190695 [Helobdella robusta]|uniref:DUF4211 domain-containing protein n=1 Tax=Helobdella robusta TaxID=6412 RepID=T1FS76_HELRO|nr:hypothetical protein HELRODRAFT_190695 [Helobdella robusta]ESO09036.1 hypothetical protein HELRODRAFT_190695 [Helobdella robusta]
MEGMSQDGQSLVAGEWDQQQVNVAAANNSQPDAVAIQELLNMNGIGPGEVMYVMVGELTYQIIGPQKPGDEVIVTPVNSGISLEDFAAISAEQESIKSELSYPIPATEDASQLQLQQQQQQQQQQQPQQFIQSADGDIYATSADGMQMMMVQENTPMVKQSEGATIKLGGQDFVLQPGQQLPPEIQEMISKGLPVDLSNYEFVIEGDSGQSSQQAFAIQQTGNDMGGMMSPMMAEQVGGGGDITGHEIQPKNGIYVQVITAAPGEFDDGEFSYLAPTAEDLHSHLLDADPHPVPNTGYMNCYLNFCKNGGKVETQASSQQSTKYAVGLKQVEEKKANLLVGASSGSGRSLLISNQQQPHKQNFKRKRSNESEGDSDAEKISRGDLDFDDPLWKLNSASRIDERRQSLTKNKKGDFVVDKKDAYKSEFAIWRIENGKLLQKFDSFFDSGKLYHKSASVYSSWSGDIRTNFKPLVADIISASSAAVGRKQDIIVKVLDKYIPKPADESLEQNALMQFFNIYVHVLLNQVFEPAYLAAIQQQNVEYYLEPMTQIDQLISEAKQAVVSEYNWNEDFKTVLETWSCYTFVAAKATESLQNCQAISDGGSAMKLVKFYGQSYDRDNLLNTQELASSSSQDFLIGKNAFANLGIYHALHHFKYLLFRKCHEEAVFQVSSMNKANSEVPDICIQNRIWVQQMFLDLKGLLDRYIIIKTEEDNTETGDSQQQEDSQQEGGGGTATNGE